MAENYIRSKGLPKGYKFDNSSKPGDSGPYVGIVKNNVDPARSGRIQVYIEQFAGPDETDQSNWRTVSYLPPFFGSTNNSGSSKGSGNYVNNKHSYGMWFTPPDLGTKVLCFFVAGESNQGYYVGCIPEDGLSHMVPAIGASANFVKNNDAQQGFFKQASRLPVTELNSLDKSIDEDPKFFEADKPVHSVVAGALWQQGIITDLVRGPISSSSQRESPSNVFGFSTPGRPIFQGGFTDENIQQAVRDNQDPNAFNVIGRKGGHSFVLDDGDIFGQDNLVRIRTSKGHQITLSDDGDALYIIHANGQSWIELGKEGTLDVFSTNSVNVRTQGTINLHADNDINMYAGGKINQYSKAGTTIESQADVGIRGVTASKIYSSGAVHIKGDNTVAIKAGKIGSFDGGDRLDLKGGCVGLNSGGGLPADSVVAIKKNKVSDSVYTPDSGWQPEFGVLETINTRVPTHEPWPYHNMGVENSVDIGAGGETSLPSQIQSTLDSLSDITPENVLSASDFSLAIPSKISIGSIDQDQVTGMMAQLEKEVGQSFDTFTPDIGVGKFGFSTDQLEKAGFLKPGTNTKFLQSGNFDTEAILKSTNVWTGKAGTDSLTEFLNSSDTQTKAMENLYLTSLSELKSQGIVKGTESPTNLAPLIQAGAKYGSANVSDWVKGTGNTQIKNAITSTARNAVYAVDYIDTKITSTVKAYGTPGAYIGTVDRTAVDLDVKNIVGNQKVPPTKY